MNVRRGRVVVPLFGAALAAGLCVPSAPAQAASAGSQAKERAARATAAAKVPAVLTGVGSALKIYAADGSLRATRSGLQNVALAPGLLAGTSLSSKDKPWTLVGVNPLTGTRTFSVPNGRLPVIVGDGPGVLFAPDPAGLRDPQDNSIWIREASGKVRRVVQFSNGPGLPGYDTGLDGEGTVLGYGVDRAGKTLVVTEGNDVDAFIYDVFAVDVAKGGVVRVTSGRKSRRAAISADGSKIVFDREVGTCGKPYIRAADLVLASSRHFTTKTTLVKGSCKAWVSNAAWVSPRTLIAVRTTITGSKGTSDVVAVDVLTHHVYPLTKVHDVFLAGAGLTNHVVAYQRDGATTSTVLTLSISSRKGTVSVLRSAAVKGEIPVVAGDNRL
jgi:hypothetical protein